MLTKREFLGPKFYAFCQQQYDEARRSLKNFGKPKDEMDRAMIQFHRTTVQVFGRLL
jgi:hypothetical protein